jgi:oligopeptide transport system substrate-binding protein
LEKHGAVDSRSTPWARPGNLVGNGPFVLTEWRQNDRVVVTKNPQYWDAARNRLERIVFLPIENPSVEERNFRAGQMHITFALPSSKLASYRQHAPDRLRIDPWIATNFVNFNVTKPPLDNAKLRRALALAIDRDAIARTVYQGAAQPALTLSPRSNVATLLGKPRYRFFALRWALAESGSESR